MDRLERERVRAEVRSGLFGDETDPPRVGPYEIRGRLGAGAMGVVYEAWDPRLRRPVALKMLHADAGDERLAERLMREAQALAQLRHPNVVAVHDVGTDDGHVYVVMERVDGETLAQWAERRQPSVAALIEVLVAAGRGLEAAHNRGLVHRDVKPENVLVSSDDVPHLVDFGLVRRIDTEVAASMRRRVSGVHNVALTHAGTVLGTPVYMAPEQLAGNPADARSDQYAFAVTSYHLLYGELPFEHESLEALLSAVESGEIRPPATRGEPAAVRDALLRAMSRDPDKRFPSMAEFLAELSPRLPAQPAISRGMIALVAVVGLGGLGTGLWVAGAGDDASSTEARDASIDDRRDAALAAADVADDAGLPDATRVAARPPDAATRKVPPALPPRRVVQRKARVGSHQNLWLNGEPMLEAAARLDRRMSRCFDPDWKYEGGKRLLSVYLKVEADGRVSNWRVERESHVPAKTKSCLLGVYRRIKRFPPTRRGFSSEVWYVIPFFPDL